MTRSNRSIFKMRNIPDRNVMTNELGLKLQEIQALAAELALPHADAGLTNAEASMLFNAWISAEAGRESYYQSSMKHERRSNQWMTWHGGVQAQLTAMTRRVDQAAHAIARALGKVGVDEMQYETLEALVEETTVKLDNRCEDEMPAAEVDFRDATR